MLWGSQALPDISQFKDSTTLFASIPTIVENFDSPDHGWALSEHFSYDRHGGVTGSGALTAERRVLGGEEVLATKYFRLKRGVTYRVTVQYRADVKEKVSHNTQEVFGVHYLKDGKLAGGSFKSYYDYGKNPDWIKKELFVNIPEDREETVRVLLTIFTHRLDKVWYDNLTIEPFKAGGSYKVFPILPEKLTLDKSGDVTFRIQLGEKDREEDFAVLAEAGGVTKLFKVQDGLATGSLKGAKGEKLELNVMLLNMKTKEIVARDKSRLFQRVIPEHKGTIQKDTDGFMLRDGKRFLPIGIFFGRYRADDTGMVPRVKEAGFNAVYCVGTLLMKEKKETVLASIQAAIRELAQHDLAYLYAIKYQMPSQRAKKTPIDGIKDLDEINRYIVNGVKNEPNMLGWYVSDENPLNEIPEIRHLRETVSECDPFHPVMTLTNMADNFMDFAATGDYLMFDSYPVGGNSSLGSGEEQTMKQSREWLARAAATKVPVIWVPQIFAWAAFNRSLAIRYPTEQEIRSMVLLGAIFNVKGYFLYAYHPIFHISPRIDPGHVDEQWDRVKKSVAVLNELTPFFLSQEKAPSVTVKQLAGSVVAARAFTHKGETAVVITADGPGKSTAAITAMPGLKSVYGKTKELRPGIYRFEGKHIDSDLLKSPQ